MDMYTYLNSWSKYANVLLFLFIMTIYYDQFTVKHLISAASNFGSLTGSLQIII